MIDEAGAKMIRLNAKANWREFNNGNCVPGGKWYRWGEVSACVVREQGYWHLSISHPRRYPTWDEIYTAWYDLCPDAEQISGAIILPRKSEYVNIPSKLFSRFPIARHRNRFLKLEKIKMAYDQKCYELAKDFLSDAADKDIDTEKNRDELAERIQTAIDDFLDETRQ
jgi:hypothetical protein